MNKTELIEKSYSAAVKGINEDWFSNDSTNWYEYIDRLPPPLKITYLVVVLHNQVFNGGFHQYFVNGYGQFSNETIAALLEIGANKRSGLLSKAYEIVNDDDAPIELFRKRLLNKDIDKLFVTDELYSPLEELDNEYYNLPDEEIEDLLGNYLEKQ